MSENKTDERTKRSEAKTRGGNYGYAVRSPEASKIPKSWKRFGG